MYGHLLNRVTDGFSGDTCTSVVLTLLCPRAMVNKVLLAAQSRDARFGTNIGFDNNVIGRWRGITTPLPSQRERIPGIRKIL